MKNEIYRHLPAIYDAAVDQSCWAKALDLNLDSIGASGAIILSVDQTSEGPVQIGYFSEIWQELPQVIAEYNQKYAQFEKTAWDAMADAPKHEVLVSSDFWANEKDIFDRPDFKFFKEVAGVGHRCGTRLNDNNRWFDALTVHYDYSVQKIPSASVDQINAVVPHIAKAVEMSRTFGILKSRYKAVLAALDYMDVGLCLALHDGTTVVHNEEAQRIFDLRDGLTLGKDRKIKCSQSTMQAQLLEMIKATSQTAIGEHDTHESTTVVEKRSGFEKYLIEVTPIRDALEEVDIGLYGALIMMVDTDNSSPISVNHLSLAYGLTKTEKAVCRLVLDGWSTPKIAEERSVSSETVKSAITSIMRKTGTNSRVQLIRLAVKVSPPVRNS